MRDEAELIREAARGDRSAFDALVRTKRELVVRVAYRITGSQDDAVDVSQAVFLRLWRGGLSRFDESRRFDTWLYRITSNAAIDAVRSRALRPAQSLAEAPEPTDTARGSDPAAALDLAELRRAFEVLSARLAPKQRAVFVLREIEGLETAEVARILDVTASTVRNHLMQARRILRDGLESEYPDLIPGGRR